MQVLNSESTYKYARVKDIMTVPAATRINGEKAISINGKWAYIQRINGMAIYRYSEQSEEWQMYQNIIKTNI